MGKSFKRCSVVVAGLLISVSLSLVNCTALLGDFELGGGAASDGSIVDGATSDTTTGEDGSSLIDGSKDAISEEACDAGAKDCVGNRARDCVGGQWQVHKCTDNKPICLAGECSIPPSCTNLLGPCIVGQSCCDSPMAEAATFNRYNRPAFPATISDIRINRFEVTVARFRAFVAAGQGLSTTAPPVGAGAHPKIPNSGWQAAYTSSLLATTATFESTLTSCAGFPNANYAPAGVISSNKKPMNCVTFFEAFAFCIWDGGRLPTVAELELATRGGTEQRAFPWGAAPLDAMHAFYCSTHAANMPCSSPDTPGGMLDVGSLPNGAGRWGHLDLFGSMREHTLDIFTPMPPTCMDCAQLNTGGGTNHGALGGSWADTAEQWTNIYNVGPTTSTNPRTPAGGLRCAYDP